MLRVAYKGVKIVINKEEGYAYIKVFQGMNMSAPEWLTVAPVATVVIMAIAFSMSLVIQTTNRVVIGRLIGWDKYRTMQKEMSEFRKESMAAARSNDKKQLEKIKKKQTQINAMQTQMMKPQIIQMALIFCYLPIWRIVFPIFGSNPVCVIPGIGSPSFTIFGMFEMPNFMIWYMIASLFLGLIASRILGTMPDT